MTKRRTKELAVNFSFHYLSRPISPTAARAIIRAAMAAEWDRVFWPAVLREYELLSESSRWNNTPAFFYLITESARKINFNAYVRKNKAGKIFFGIDYGTGEEGPKRRKYPIAPRRFNPKWIKKRKTPSKGPLMLKFVVPYQPKTTPMGGTRYSSGAAPRTIIIPKIMHPGTRPRHFSQRVIHRLIRDFMGPGTFYTTTMTGFNRGLADARARGVIP